MTKKVIYGPEVTRTTLEARKPCKDLLLEIECAAER